MDDQCALGPDGQLLDESEIVWHHDPDDTTTIIPSLVAPATTSTHPFFTEALLQPLSFPAPVALAEYLNHQSVCWMQTMLNVLEAPNIQELLAV